MATIREIKNGSRRISFSEDMKILKGVTNVVIYERQPSESITFVKNRYNNVLSVDITKRESSKYTVIYFGNLKKIKVIIHSKGKSFVGISRCHEEDTYSAQTGSEIAYNRAAIKKLEHELKELCK